MSTADRGGGAEGSALNLFRAYRERGHTSRLAVGRKHSQDADIAEIPRERAAGFGRILQGLAGYLRNRGWRLKGREAVARHLDVLASPLRRRARANGIEDFNFPGTGRLLHLFGTEPDVIHCHNLHGWYFDLRRLPELSRQAPLILNLRDAWLLTGHCAYFMECPRWRSGCGECPDLARYPGIRRDATAANWQCKADIFARSKVFVTAPSKWLVDCARESMLSAVEYQVIPNGIDTKTFRSGDRGAARERLSLPPDRRIVLFVGASQRNVYKDPETMVEAVTRISQRSEGRDVLFVCLGNKPPRELAGVPLRTIPFQSDPSVVADYYRSADLFVHTARAEAFGKTATEAMACGTPVVATAVGGLPEQVVDGETGFLTPLRDAEAIAERAGRILGDNALRDRLGLAAAKRGASFSLDRQVEAFLSWYEHVRNRWST